MYSIHSIWITCQKNKYKLAPSLPSVCDVKPLMSGLGERWPCNWTSTVINQARVHLVICCSKFKWNVHLHWNGSVHQSSFCSFCPFLQLLFSLYGASCLGACLCSCLNECIHPCMSAFLCEVSVFLFLVETLIIHALWAKPLEACSAF